MYPIWFTLTMTLHDGSLKDGLALFTDGPRCIVQARYAAYALEISI